MAEEGGERIEPYLMVVLSRRFDAISRQMTNTLLRSARSIVVNTAREAYEAEDYDRVIEALAPLDEVEAVGLFETRAVGLCHAACLQRLQDGHICLKGR